MKDLSKIGIISVLMLSANVAQAEEFAIIARYKDSSHYETLRQGEVVRSFSIGYVLSFGLDNRQLVVVGPDSENKQTIRLYDRETGLLQLETEVPGIAMSSLWGPQQRVVFQEDGQLAYFISYRQTDNQTTFFLNRFATGRGEVETLPLPAFLNQGIPALSKSPSGLILANSAIENLFIYQPSEKSFLVFQPDPKDLNTLGEKEVVFLPQIGVFETQDALRNLLPEMAEIQQATTRKKTGAVRVLSFREGRNHFFLFTQEEGDATHATVLSISKETGETEILFRLPSHIKQLLSSRQRDMPMWWDSSKKSLMRFDPDLGAPITEAQFGPDIYDVCAVLD